MLITKNTIETVRTALSNYKTVVFSLKNKQYIIKNNAGVITVDYNNTIEKYENIEIMEHTNLFYGKLLKDIIDNIFIAIV